VESIADSLAAMGARPWQIDATAQTITQAFVEALQEPVEASEDDS
jgi:ribonuclease D